MTFHVTRKETEAQRGTTGKDQDLNSGPSDFSGPKLYPLFLPYFSPSND